MLICTVANEHYRQTREDCIQRIGQVPTAHWPKGFIGIADAHYASTHNKLSHGLNQPEIAAQNGLYNGNWHIRII